MFFLFFLLDDGKIRRPKNKWIRWIRIRNTASLSCLLRPKVMSDAELRNPHNGGSVILGLGSTDLAYLGRILCVLFVVPYFVNVTLHRQLIPFMYPNI
jgi:hypothetical protein